MPRRKKVPEEVGGGEPTPAPTQEAVSAEAASLPEQAQSSAPEKPKRASAKTTAGVFNVSDSLGKFIRAYTVEKHGPEAGKLAKEFASKIEGTVEAE